MFTFVVALLVCHWKRLTRGIARGCVLVSEHSWKISECRIITPAPYFQPFPTLNIYTLHLILPFLDTHRIRYYASGAHHCHVSICIGAWRESHCLVESVIERPLWRGQNYEATLLLQKLKQWHTLEQCMQVLVNQKSSLHKRKQYCLLIKNFQLFYLNEVTYLGKNKDMYLYQCI